MHEDLSPPRGRCVARTSRAQLHRLSVHASTDNGHTSDATYRFGFRETTQNGEYYHLNGVRVNLRGDSLQGADYDRIDNSGKGDAYWPMCNTPTP
jgi:hypothetical protein